MSEKGGPKRLIETRKDERSVPVYSVEEAAGYLGIPISTLQSWIGARKKLSGGGYYPAILQSVDQDTRRLSFYDLVEAHILRAAIDVKVPIRRLKRGMEYLREKHPKDPRPLLSYSFKTEGKNLLIGGMLGSIEKDQVALVSASDFGQIIMADLIPEYIKTVAVFDEYLKLVARDRKKVPDTLFPKGGGKVVSITSGIYSGRPVIEGTRIPTRIVAQRFSAGEDIKALAKDYRIPKEKIEAAIKYESAA